VGVGHLVPYEGDRAGRRQLGAPHRSPSLAGPPERRGRAGPGASPAGRPRRARASLTSEPQRRAGVELPSVRVRGPVSAVFLLYVRLAAASAHGQESARPLETYRRTSMRHRRPCERPVRVEDVPFPPGQEQFVSAVHLELRIRSCPVTASRARLRSLRRIAGRQTGCIRRVHATAAATVPATGLAAGLSVGSSAASRSCTTDRRNTGARRMPR
jgi:hypothetical protein